MINEIGYINSLIIDAVAYIDVLMGGNEFAVGALVAGISATGLVLIKGIPLKIYNFIIKHVTTSFEIDNTTDTFYNFMKFLNRSKFLEQARYIKAGKQFDEDENSLKQIGYGTQLFWFNWYTPVLISSYKEDSPTHYVKQFIKIKKFGRSHKLFDDILSDADKNIDYANTTYYTYTSFKTEIITQPIRTFDTIALPKTDLKYLIDGIDKFITNKSWCLKHKIPYQLGILLEGPPGTGKTSLIKAIAAYLNKNIVLVQDATALTHAAQTITDCVIVAEEIDAFEIINRDEPVRPHIDISRGVTLKNNKTGLSNILNALDGIVSNNGRIVIMTTNYPEDLDPALLRPGRVDIRLHVGYLTNETFELFVSKFFSGVSIRAGKKVIDNLSPANVQNDIINGLTSDELLEKYTM